MLNLSIRSYQPSYRDSATRFPRRIPHASPRTATHDRLQSPPVVARVLRALLGPFTLSRSQVVDVLMEATGFVLLLVAFLASVLLLA